MSSVQDYPDTKFGVLCLVIWMLWSWTFTLMGCITGFLCAAFVRGYKRGYGDYKRYLEPID